MADIGNGAGRDPSGRPPWHELEALRPLTLRSCRRIVVVAAHPRDEIRAAGGLLRRLASRHATLDVLSLTDPPTRTCTGAGATPTGSFPVLGSAGTTVPGSVPIGPGGLDAAALDVFDDEPAGDGPDDGVDDDGDPGEVAVAAAYRTLGLVEVRRHRLGLPDGAVAAFSSDVVGAISEIVGFADDPGGLCVLAPWSGDGDDDHEAAGRAAEVVTAAYRIRLVRWLDQAWSWAGPESAEVPWRRARQVPLSETTLARKLEAAALVASDVPTHDRELPDGSAPGPREVFLV